MLPYTSIGEAEVELGRHLSLLEALWLRRTANFSDYMLYCFNIVFLFIIFNLAPLPTVFIDLCQLKAFQKYKLQPSVSNSPSHVLRCYKTVMYTFFTVVLPLQILSFPAIKFLGFRTSLPLPSFWEVCAQIAVYFLVEDYGNYWIHRWLHSSWGYNKIHYMHHEFTAPISFAAPYAHWAEVLALGIPSFIGPALVPGHMVTLWLWIALRQIEAIETHCGYVTALIQGLLFPWKGYDFPWSPTKLIPFYGGSEYHDYHHFVGGKSQSNFASVFTYCDYIYGTDKGYRYQKDFLAQIRKRRAVDETSDMNSTNHKNN